MKNLSTKVASTILLTSVLSLPNTSFAHEDGPEKLIRPDSHAPIGVMGDHMHKKGEWMLGARFANMDMKGLLNGTTKLTPDDVATMSNPNMPPATFRIVPEAMSAKMYMFGVMYAPTDNLTVVVGANLIEKEMLATTYQGMMGTNTLGQTTLKTSDLNSLKTVALIRLYEKNGSNLHLGLGLTAPLGSIDETGSMLAPNGMTMEGTLAYPMQTGSGTMDFLPNVTYSYLGDVISGGVQYSGKFTLEKNNAGYSFGDQNALTGWVSALVHENASLSLRLTYEKTGQIDGADSRITGATPGAIPAMQGRKSLNTGFGVNYVFQRGALKGHRFAAEFIIPLKENTNGPQLEKNYKFVTGWQYAF